MSRSATIEIAGQTLAVKTAGKSQYLSELARYVEEKLAEVARGPGRRSPSALALLAAMNIADELAQCKQELATFKAEVADRSRSILRYLDEVALLGRESVHHDDV